MSWFNNAPPEEIIGKVLKDYSVNSNYDKLTLRFDDDSCCKFYHEQDCCESVVVEEIIGDIEDLENWPLLIAREDHDAEGEELPNSESYTWTFYNFATFKGYVTIRFLGESNGYYSEEVYCMKEEL